jgi:hypothetical protein
MSSTVLAARSTLPSEGAPTSLRGSGGGGAAEMLRIEGLNAW